METENELKVEETTEVTEEVEGVEVAESADDKTAVSEATETTDEAEAVEPTLAEQALAEVSEESVEKPDPKDAVIGGFRKELRESQKMIADLNSQVEALKPKEKEPEPVKSPYELAAEKAAEEQEVSVDEAEVTVTGKLLKEQQAFERKQQESQTTVITQKQAEQTLHNEFVKAGEVMDVKAMGEGLDFKSVMEMSEGLITQEEMAGIIAKVKKTAKTPEGIYPEFYKRLYGYAVKEIVEAGGENAKNLRAAIKNHSQAKTKLKTPEKPVVPKREEIIGKATSVHDAHLNSLM